MSKNPISLSLDFHQWGVVLDSDLARLRNFVTNFTTNPTGTFGPVDASVVLEFHQQLDKMKVMATAWAAAYQKQAVQFQSSSPMTSPPDSAPQSLITTNGAPTSQGKKPPVKPKKNADEKRARLVPQRAST